MRITRRKAIAADFDSTFAAFKSRQTEHDYVIVLELRDGDVVIESPLALVQREKMAGSGSCNMWGSPFRWAAHTRGKLRKDRAPDIHGWRTDYFDSLGDAVGAVEAVVHRAAVQALNTLPDKV